MKGDNIVTFNSKQELYKYLNEFDFDSVRDTKLSSVYFLIVHNDCVEPIYFTSFEDVWFESPCDLYKFPLIESQLMQYVQEQYEQYSFNDAYEYEKIFQKGDWHYEIDCPQCMPFLPETIKIIDVFSEKKCLEWLLGKYS